MRIGDLVEHQHGAFVGEVFQFERGEGIGLDQQPLMHRIGREPRRDRVRPHDLRRHRQGEAFFVEPVCAVLGCEDLPDLAARIGERGRDRVPAIEDRDALRDAGRTGLGLGAKRLLSFGAARAARRAGFRGSHFRSGMTR